LLSVTSNMSVQPKGDSDDIAPYVADDTVGDQPPSADLAGFIDRVIVPALVDRLLGARDAASADALLSGDRARRTSRGRVRIN
jgi:hypothetical protein